MTDELYQDILNELYEEATPSLDELQSIDGLKDKPLNYMQYLDGDRQFEIIDKYCDEYDIPEHARKQVRFDVILGPSPSTSIENVNRVRTEAGLGPLQLEDAETG